ncbi:hypothetical protein NDU88_005637 [Pleurodeles waltl]|uniref:Uncharacterized protein n=1 Tax=Pleurodeles waltl TaxID=8319 RepID=A0AAV7TBZ0_PLEWA|nr:hypothetical protein NDU88_005637 [Pleurodeles waltl]
MARTPERDAPDTKQQTGPPDLPLEPTEGPARLRRCVLHRLALKVAGRVVRRPGIYEDRVPDQNQRRPLRRVPPSGCLPGGVTPNQRNAAEGGGVPPGRSCGAVTIETREDTGNPCRAEWGRCPPPAAQEGDNLSWLSRTSASTTA